MTRSVLQDGEANAELIDYLRGVLGVRKSDISVDKGSRSRFKMVSLSKDSKLSCETVIELLKKAAE